MLHTLGGEYVTALSWGRHKRLEQLRKRDMFQLILIISNRFITGLDTTTVLNALSLYRVLSVLLSNPDWYLVTLV